MATEQRLLKLREAARRRRQGFLFSFENLHDPHNGAAAVRSLEGLGFADIGWIDKQPPEFSPQVARGARKWARISHVQSPVQLHQLCRASGMKLWVAALEEGACSSEDWQPQAGPTCFLFGNEHAGVSAESLQLADQVFRIPIIGMIQSYNVSVSSALTAWHVHRCLESSGNGWWSTNRLQAQLYLDEWLAG